MEFRSGKTREVSFLSHNAGGSASLKCDFTRVSLSTTKIGNISYRELIRRLGPGGYHWAHYVEFSSSNAEWIKSHQVIFRRKIWISIIHDWTFKIAGLRLGTPRTQWRIDILKKVPDPLLPEIEFSVTQAYQKFDNYWSFCCSWCAKIVAGMYFRPFRVII